MDALPHLVPVGPDYASMPVADAFNWQEAAAELGAGDWYLVAFRSIRKATADEARLNEFDERAHVEAAAAPGFIHYFKGPAALDGSCLSFCLWQTRADARAAAGRPDHVRAVSLIAEMYESYTLEFHRVARASGGPLTFESYDRAAAPAPVATSTAERLGDVLDIVIDAPSLVLPSQPAIPF
ncbi:MAG: hypothetical protein QOF49_635 [Chloroflexota bacterium]|jgi:hypothetical protein|nr:hypothetical protein [Chloroflexota bacterium]